jgi:hypothetical protein
MFFNPKPNPIPNPIIARDIKDKQEKQKEWSDEDTSWLAQKFGHADLGSNDDKDTGNTGNSGGLA